MSYILVTGGAGYIGSHTVLQLLLDGYNIIAFDNFVNSSITSLNRVKDITNKDFLVIKGDICNDRDLTKVFKNNKIDAVIHFAGLKSVQESSVNPHSYYKNNVSGSLSLIQKMNQFNVNKLIFSSSATVYGQETPVPYLETMKVGTQSSPYGFSKMVTEKIIADTVASNEAFKAVSLRYFNPIGAHESGRIGENPKGIPNNLLPYISQVAIGKRERLLIHGNDYSTHDGTCKRDYLHVMDLADGHICALEYLDLMKKNKYEIFNLGLGAAVSVLDIVNKFNEVTGVEIPFTYGKRREGDLSEFWADSSKAKNLLGWSCKRDLSKMIEDTWRWQKNNPNGY